MFLHSIIWFWITGILFFFYDEVVCAAHLGLNCKAKC